MMQFGVYRRVSDGKIVALCAQRLLTVSLCK